MTTLDPSCYRRRAVYRRQHFIGLRNRTESAVEARWLLRRWAEDGASRPLVLVLTQYRDYRWVIPTKASVWQTRFGRPRSSYAYCLAYQVNQRTGSWTTTRSKYVYEREISAILPVTDPLVRKVRAWAVSQRLGM